MFTIILILRWQGALDTDLSVTILKMFHLEYTLHHNSVVKQFV